MGELADFLCKHDANFRSARLPALYSNFQCQQSLNPDGYQANIDAWKHALAKAASNGRLSGQDHLIISIDNQLYAALEHRQYGRPLALGAVLDESIASGDFVPLRHFLSAAGAGAPPRTWARVAWDLVAWTTRQLGLFNLDGISATGQYVVLENVTAAARVIAGSLADTTAASSSFDRVLSRSRFEKDFQSVLGEGRALTGRDMEIILTFLSRKPGLIAYDGRVVKVRGPGTTAAPPPITEDEAAIASLKDLIDDLETHTALLSARLDEHAAAAKTAVMKNNTVAAKAALRSKRAVEQLLETRFATLHQLNQVAGKIRQASDQVEMVKALEASAVVLQGLNRQVGGADRVDEIMHRLRDQMGELDEVNTILSEGTKGPVDEAEVDAELESLLVAARTQEEAQPVENEKEEEQAAAELKRRLGQMRSPPDAAPALADAAAAAATSEPSGEQKQAA